MGDHSERSWLERRVRGLPALRFLKFGLVGASGVLVNLAGAQLGFLVLFAGFEEPGRSAAAFLLGIAISIVSNFLLNEAWTWRDRALDGASRWGRFRRFLVVSIGAAGAQFGISMALVFALGWGRIPSQCVGIGLAAVLNFAVNHLWTFAHRRGHTEAPAGPELRECA